MEMGSVIPSTDHRLGKSRYNKNKGLLKPEQEQSIVTVTVIPILPRISSLSIRPVKNTGTLMLCRIAIIHR